MITTECEANEGDVEPGSEASLDWASRCRYDTKKQKKNRKISGKIREPWSTGSFQLVKMGSLCCQTAVQELA